MEGCIVLEEAAESTARMIHVATMLLAPPPPLPPRPRFRLGFLPLPGCCPEGL